MNLVQLLLIKFSQYYYGDSLIITGIIIYINYSHREIYRSFRREGGRDYQWPQQPPVTILVALYKRGGKSLNYALFWIFLITVSSALSPPCFSSKCFQFTTLNHHPRRSFIPRGKFNEGFFLNCIPVGLSKFDLLKFRLNDVTFAECRSRRRVACELVTVNSAASDWIRLQNLYKVFIRLDRCNSSPYLLQYKQSCTIEKPVGKYK